MASAKPDRTAADPILAALAHPLRAQLLREYRTPRSPKEIAGEIREPLGNVSYHTRTLAAAGLLRLERTEPRRGAVAHYYYVVPATAKKAIRQAAASPIEFTDSL